MSGKELLGGAGMEPAVTVIGLNAVTNKTLWDSGPARLGVYEAIQRASGGRDDYVFMAAFMGRLSPVWNYQDIEVTVPPSRAGRRTTTAFTVVALDEVNGDVQLFPRLGSSAAEIAQDFLDNDPVWIPQSILEGKHESLLLYQEWGLKADVVSVPGFPGLGLKARAA